MVDNDRVPLSGQTNNMWTNIPTRYQLGLVLPFTTSLQVPTGSLRHSLAHSVPLMTPSEATMGELAEAQAELARLQRAELDLLAQISDIRTAAEVQKRKIAILLGMTPVLPSNDVTHRLPAELLSRILGFALHAPVSKRPVIHHDRKRQLASVSRRWRDTILNDPHLWTTIIVRANWNLPLVQVYLTRSRDCLLDIEVYPWTFHRYSESQTTLLNIFNILLTHARRWRSIMVSSGPLKLDGVATASFPSLVRIELHDDTANRFMSYLDPARLPALRHLELRTGVLHETPSEENTIINLMLAFSEYPSRLPLRLKKLSSLTLTSLLLSGNVDTSSVRPDSVRLLLLERLTLKVSRVKELLEAFVAPKLEYLDCFNCKESRSPFVVFGGIQSKYTGVRQLSFHLCGPPDDLPYEEVEFTCMTFPNVHHVVIPPSDITPLIGFSESPADNWERLESLTVIGGTLDQEMVGDDFQLFLKRRQRKGRRVAVKFSKINLTPRSAVREVYMQLYKCCSLEMEDITVSLPMCLSLKTGCPARVVRAFPWTRSHYPEELYPPGDLESRDHSPCGGYGFGGL